MESIKSQFDVSSKFFRIVLSLICLWLIAAFALAWSVYDDRRNEEIPMSQQARNWLCDDSPFVDRSPSLSERQNCLTHEAAREASWREAHEIAARNDAILWFALWGLTLSFGILTFAALRVILTSVGKQIWESYWRWLNGNSKS